MKLILIGSVVASGLFFAAPASAQTIEIGPNGPGIDLRSPREREREEIRREERREMRREERRRDFDDDDRRGPRDRY